MSSLSKWEPVVCYRVEWCVSLLFHQSCPYRQIVSSEALFMAIRRECLEVRAVLLIIYILLRRQMQGVTDDIYFWTTNSRGGLHRHDNNYL